MKKDKKWVAWTSAALIFIGYMMFQIYVHRPNVIVTGVVAVLLIIFVFINPESLQKLVVDLKSGKVEFDKAKHEATVALAKVDVSTEQFNRTVDAFLGYNLADFQNQGSFDATVPWHTGMNFVREAIRMHKMTGKPNDDILELIVRAQQKVFDLFIEDMYHDFPEILEKARKLIYSGYNDLNIGPKFKEDRAFVDFEKLRSLGNTLSPSKKTKWNSELHDLEQFYHEAFATTDA